MMFYFNNKDISQSRLDFAKQIGADYVLLAEGDSQATAKSVVETLGSQPNISIECSGAESSIQTTFYVSCLSFFKKKDLLFVNLGYIIRWCCSPCWSRTSIGFITNCQCCYSRNRHSWCFSLCQLLSSSIEFDCIRSN